MKHILKKVTALIVVLVLVLGIFYLKDGDIKLALGRLFLFILLFPVICIIYYLIKYIFE